MNENIIKTYSEIYCLLKYFPEEYINKIPKKLLDLIQNTIDAKYFIEVDTDKNLEEQNISQDTKNMLVVLKYNYWSSEPEKRQMSEQLNENERIFQAEQREKYNPDKVFKKIKERKAKSKDSVSELSIIEYKESLISKIVNKIKRYFKIRK